MTAYLPLCCWLCGKTEAQGARIHSYPPKHGTCTIDECEDCTADVKALNRSTPKRGKQA